MSFTHTLAAFAAAYAFCWLCLHLVPMWADEHARRSARRRQDATHAEFCRTLEREERRQRGDAEAHQKEMRRRAVVSMQATAGVTDRG